MKLIKDEPTKNSRMKGVLTFITRTLIFFTLVYYFGFINASILFIVTHSLIFSIILKCFFGLKEIHGLEYIFHNLDKKNKYFPVGILVFKNYDATKIREIMIERGLKTFPRLRSKIVDYFGHSFWKVHSVEEASKQLKITDKKFKTAEELQEYASERQHVEIENEFFFEAHLVKYKEEGAMIFRFDHTMSDGMGAMGMLICLSDNYSLKLYPKFTMPNSILVMFAKILSPIYCLIYLYYLLVKIKENDSPFKTNHGEFNGVKKIAVSKLFDVEILKHLSKDNGMTFNDMISCIVSKVMNKHFKLHNSKATKYSSIVPVNMRLPANFRHEHRIENDFANVGFQLDLIEDVIKEEMKIKKTLNKWLKNPLMVMGSNFFSNIGPNYLPSFIVDWMMKTMSTKMDILISNVPGPIEKLVWDGCTVEEFYPIPCAGTNYFLLLVNSYNGKFVFTASKDMMINIDQKLYIKDLEEEIDSLIKENLNKAETSETIPQNKKSNILPGTISRKKKE